jgi:hypothetical protein
MNAFYYEKMYIITPAPLLRFCGGRNGNDVKILPRRRLYVEICTERQNFNVLS